MASYPGAIKTFTTKTNKVDLVDAEHVNSLQEEVVAVQTELGINVAGSETDLKTRIYVCLDNDGAVRKGTSFPGSPIEGQIFYRTDEKLLYEFDSSAWRSYVLRKGTSFPGSPLEGQLFYRTDEDTPYIFDGSSWDSLLGIADGAVTQVKLSTATGEVSITKFFSTAGNIDADLTLPGGQYGFRPQTKCTSSGDLVSGRVSSSMDSNMEGVVAAPTFTFRSTSGNPNESYVTRIHLALAFADSGSNITMNFYARQRYITASGHDHWIFLLVDKTTKEVISSYQAPDHPSANQGGATEIDIPHPFGSYDPIKHEIVIVDNTELAEMYQRVTSRRSLLMIINEDYMIDDTKNPIWTPREIIKIDEYGDMEGEIIKVLKTPEWAKILIGAPEVTLKRRMVETLPVDMLFKRMMLK